MKTQSTTFIYISRALLAAALLAGPTACTGQTRQEAPTATAETPAAATLKVGAERPGLYMPLLEDKRVGLLSNHTGVLSDSTHTLDYLLRLGVNVRVLFSPEHGFRGTADAGEHVAASTDSKTGLPIVSLYTGGRKGVPPQALNMFDVLVVDLQDVGARFYTYHITMKEMMEAAARAGKKVVVLDRPNPLGMVVDGPMLAPGYTSGVGQLPVPAVHGMTMGELAMMINGEHWLKEGLTADLTVIPVEGYTHDTRYTPPVAPSPNLRDEQAILLYPSLCLMEGTPVSVGRGTEAPFTRYGSPAMMPDGHPFTFTPESGPGAKQPMYEGEMCYGVDLRGLDQDTIIARGFDPSYVIDAWKAVGSPQRGFFKRMFDLLAGSDTLKRQIERGATVEQIKASWQPGLKAYREMRRKYLLYPEEAGRGQ